MKRRRKVRRKRGVRKRRKVREREGAPQEAMLETLHVMMMSLILLPCSFLSGDVSQVLILMRSYMTDHALK